ncbi:HlyD family secretion protein [Candidatus Methylocalor cossyra]|uniref:Predicted membrane fusion protein (MFP) component of efflux pump, membrane anchor protein YbhG n=1 Tax=Candidatus Methylocalor cossyra TaxID=3108543 RepID=A0ABM9NLR9_9GAMM
MSLCRAWLSPALVIALLAGCRSEQSLPPVVGTLEWDRVELIAEASEPIVHLAVEEGDWVTVGQPLVQLDVAPYQERLEGARSYRERIRSRVLQLQQEPGSESLQRAETRLKEAEQALAAQGREVERLLELARRNLAGPEAVERARAAREAAQRERDDAAAALRDLQVGARKEQLVQGRLALAAAEAALARQEVDFARLTVRAPVEGRVDRLPLKPGDRPQVGQVVAVMLSGPGPHARVYLPEAVRPRVQPGDPARIHIDATGQSFPGVVRSVDDHAVFTPAFLLGKGKRKQLSYPAEIVLEGDVRKLPAGVSVRVELPRLALLAP